MFHFLRGGMSSCREGWGGIKIPTWREWRVGGCCEASLVLGMATWEKGFGMGGNHLPKPTLSIPLPTRIQLQQTHNTMVDTTVDDMMTLQSLILLNSITLTNSPFRYQII